MSLTESIFSLQDKDYQKFQQKLIPNIDKETIIGVRTPELRKLAKELDDKEVFLNSLPHSYFKENQIHAFVLEDARDFSEAIIRVAAFLPYVNNWAACDQLRPKVFGKHRRELLPYIKTWLDSSHAYTIRFAIAMLMCHFLDKDFDPVYPEWVASVSNGEYYVKMMIAWYFATALAKQYNTILPYITERKLESWTHRKTIQKAVESYRITPEQKEILMSFR